MIYLKKHIDRQSGEEFAILDGDTYYSRVKIANAGFTWYSNISMGERFWRMKNEDFKRNLQNILPKLKELNVDTSGYPDLNNTQSEPNVKTEESKDNTVNNQSNPNKTSKIVTDKTSFDEKSEGMYEPNPGVKYMGFPIKAGICKTDYIIPDSGDKIDIIVDRSYVKGRRGIPKYKFRLFYKEWAIGSMAVDSTGTWQSGRPLFNEEDFIENYINEKIPSIFDKDKPTKGYSNYLNAKNLEKRDPEIKELIEAWNQRFEKNYSEEYLKNLTSKYIPNKYISLNEQGFEGDFPVKVDIISNYLTVKTDLDDSLAPSPAFLGQITLNGKYLTFDDISNAIDKLLQSEEAKKAYIEYLKSFPYSKESKEKANFEMKEIISMIGNSFDIPFFKAKLIERDFIRQNKRDKRLDSGFVPQEEVNYIVDDKVIRDAVYSRRINNPDSFYTILAYFLMRKVRQTAGWGVVLTSDIDYWVRLAQKFGLNINVKDVYDYLDKLAYMMSVDITGKDPEKERREQSRKYYENQDRGNSGNFQGVRQDDRALDEFVSFAVSQGFNEDEARKNPKITWRQMALKLHPDRNIGNVNATEMFTRMQNLYDNLPDIYKKANNWYARSKFARN